MARASPEFELNTKRFELIRCLGRGGMGVVYEAVDREHDTRIALKTLNSVGADSLLRFKKEFRDFQDLSHPNLVNLGELFCDEGQWYFTMELLDGRPFLDYLSNSAGTLDAASSHTTITTSVPKGFVAPTTAATHAYDEGRLRDGFLQLARGLVALHQAGKIHRDVKPSNVMVTREGRVVLLDFGLSKDLTERDLDFDAAIVGTIAYMAPEQAAARPAGPEADWYAVGVMLFEALTCTLPFTGRAMEVLDAKQRLDGPAPSTLNPGVPQDLDQLCKELLTFQPSRRPKGTMVLTRLGENPSSVQPGESPSLSSMSGSGTYVGRGHQLDQLLRIFDEVPRAGGTLAYLTGESGMGKSSLARQFLRRIEHQAVVLGARCYEREFVPYKGVDGLIDSLSKALTQLSGAEVHTLLPRHAGLLCEVFPVLARVEAFANAVMKQEPARDPVERRTRLFAGVRDLFQKLCARHRVVLYIDDLQWTDADSLALLAELLRPPSAPNLLLLATVRTGGPADEDWRLAFGDLAPKTVREVNLGRLPELEATQLARALLERMGEHTDSVALQVARESGGHPMFIEELIRQGQERRDATGAIVPLEQALWDRVLQLDPPARRLVELVSLASGWLFQEAAARAAELGTGDFLRLVGQLRVAHLVRTNGARGTDRIEPYHGRVGEAVRTRLPQERIQVLHRRLAVVLESTGNADPEALVEHWSGAGEALRAAHHAERAAAKAERALAFDRAARFYQLCLSVPGTETERALRLRVQMGEALENAGRGADAAEAFLAAAESANAVERLEFTRRAAEQLLRGGHVERGVSTLEKVLSALDVRQPEAMRNVLASLLWRRGRLWMRGLRFEERQAAQLSSEQLVRVDAAWSAATGISMVHPIRGADYQARHLWEALRLGEPYRVARSLALEAAYTSMGGLGSAEKAQRLHALAHGLAQRLDRPHALGLTHVARGIIAFEGGHWSTAREAMEQADRLLRDRCLGVAWELGMATLFRLTSLFYLGEMNELSHAVPALVQEAAARGDRHATTNLRLTSINSAWLVSNEPDVALRQANEALAEWTVDRYLAQHYYHLLAVSNIELYGDTKEESWRRVEQQWKKLQGSMMLRVQVVRCEAWHLRGRAALQREKPDVSEALRCAQVLSREGAPYATALGKLLSAAGEKLKGETDQAIASLDQAASAFDGEQMRLFAAAARYFRGRLLGGEVGRGDSQAAEKWMRDQGVQAPASMARMLAPGFEG